MHGCKAPSPSVSLTPLPTSQPPYLPTFPPSNNPIFLSSTRPIFQSSSLPSCPHSSLPSSYLPLVLLPIFSPTLLCIFYQPPKPQATNHLFQRLSFDGQTVPTILFKINQGFIRSYLYLVIFVQVAALSIHHALPFCGLRAARSVLLLVLYYITSYNII